MKSFLYLFFFLFFAAYLDASFILMIDPAGDAKNTGRQLDDSFERGITLQCAQRLAHVVESKVSGVRIVFTRMPGETVHELQNANFSNRMDVDLYLSIHFFQEHETLPRWYVYSYAQQEDCIIKPVQLALYSYDQAYLLNKKLTDGLLDIAKKRLQHTSIAGKTFNYSGIFQFPFKPLIGISAPALAFEIGLKHKDDWQACIEPISEILQHMIAYLKERADE